MSHVLSSLHYIFCDDFKDFSLGLHFCENSFDTNDSNMNFILLQRRFDASCIIFKLQANTIVT